MKAICFFVVCLVALLALATAEKDYTDFVNKIKADISNPKGIFYHKAYERLAYMTDTFGNRMWGSSNLESAIKWLASEAINEGFENVHLEAVKNFTKWVRGTETLTLYSPRPTPTNLRLIGLGGSVAGNILANAIVVRNWSELDAMKDKVKGKIVVYNEPWINYGVTVDYRVNGASRAAAYGAVAALVRSVTPESIESVHAGVMHYDASQPKIPVAAITMEDAEMFQRMQDRNQTITLRLVLENQVVSGCYSNNVIFEIKGSTYPDQILLMGGHIDTWDTGSQTGANDDGGGFLTVFEAMRLLMNNGLRPKRTLRFIAWSGEEWGGLENGAHQYARDHKDEVSKHVVAFENDLGSTRLLGFGYTGDSGMEIVKEIGEKYLSLLGAGLVNENGEAADTAPLHQGGVPIMANIVADTDDHSFYFKYHHSAGDSMSMMNPDEMDSNVVGIAAMFYILADLDTTVGNVQTIAARSLRAD